MHRGVVRRDVGSGPLEFLPEAYRPVPDGPGARDQACGEVYAGAWDGDRELLAPAALAPAALAEQLLSLDVAVQAVGDGAVRFRSELEGAGVAVPADGSSVHRMTAAPLCRLGAVGEPAERDRLLPDYRREPDAKPPHR